MSLKPEGAGLRCVMWYPWLECSVTVPLLGSSSFIESLSSHYHHYPKKPPPNCIVICYSS